MGVLWTNGHIFTMENEGEKVEAVYTKNGTIYDIGNRAELKEKYRDEITEEFDLQGKTMLPGFVDSHIHLIGFGELLLRLDLSKMTSKKEVLEAVNHYAKQLEKDEWLIGEGWNENNWQDDQELTKDDIDKLVSDRPVVLKRICRHVMVVNSKTLQIAGITDETESPPGGLIIKKDGQLTGILKDAAQELILQKIPKPTIEYLKRALKKAIKTCYQYGLTGVHTEDLNYYGSFERTYQAFKEVIEEEKLLFRTHLLVHHEVIDEWKKRGHTYLSGTDFIEFGAMKIFADGSLGGRTALLSFPYKDDPTTNGICVHPLPELKKLIQKARKLQLPVAIHAIGDLAVEWVLEAIEENPAPPTVRDRLIHAPLLRKELIERLKKLPIVVDIQPRFLVSDFPWVIKRVGEHDIDHLYAWKTLIKNEIPCAAGSDAPIEPIQPLEGIHAAVTRQIPNDPSGKIYFPDERLTIFEAVSLYTKGSAYASFHENTRGKIKKGYVADFTILDKNLFEIDPDEIVNVRVAYTVIAEKIVYHAPFVK